MKNYKMVIQYDGSRYKGWQRLKDQDMTIQGKLEDILSIFDNRKVEVIGSGRTDAGVHAYGQVANFHIERKTSPEELLFYINNYLPEDIAVISVNEVDDRFHARYNAIEKTYRYCIWTSDIPDVFNRKYRYSYLDSPLDIALMKRASKDLVGRHDFFSFCGNSHMKKSTERTIFSIDINQNVDLITIDYTGDGFLQNMVRILTGTLIEVGAKKISAQSMTDVLAAKDRSKAGFTAPAQGLALLKVKY